MQRVGTESWQFTSSENGCLDLALLLRDALQLSVDADVVPPRSVVPDRSDRLPPNIRERAAAAWLDWWTGLVEIETDARGLHARCAPVQSSVLHRPYVQLLPELRKWADARHDSSRGKPEPAFAWELLSRVAQEVAYDPDMAL